MKIINTKRLFPSLFRIFTVAGLLLPGLLSAQPCSDVTLNDARKNYDNGMFTEVIRTLNPCVNKGFNEKQKVEAYRLLAMTYLAIDSTDQATRVTSALLQINPTYEANLFDPPSFIRLVGNLKLAGGGQIVTSVSKKAESIYEAPATIIVITREEIQRRGYNDLIEMLKDIPGFDLSMWYGGEYANFYQRGFRQTSTDKTLLLVDGMEENDLWSNKASIDRQYPLSNIDRVEVIYGPASTMYGPLAFTGVINVITRSATDAIKPGKNVGISGKLNYGTYNTVTADVSVAAKYRNMSISVTGRYFQSDEMSLTSQSFFDYDPAYYDGVDYNKIMDVTTDAKAYLLKNKLPFTSPYYTVAADTSSITLSPYGVESARKLDKSAYEQTVDGHKVGFTNDSREWFVNAKVRIGNFSFGVQTWRYNRGSTTQYTDTYVPGSQNGFTYVPMMTLFFVKYENQLSEKVYFSNLTTYRIHVLTDKSRFVSLNNYARGNLKVADLVTSKEPSWITQYAYEISKQLRDEVKIIYRPVSRFDLVTGLEVRNSTIQGAYLMSLVPTPQDSAVVTPNPKGGNDYNIWDIGIYAQGTFQAFRKLKITVGLRYDYDRIRDQGGFGSEFSPRIAVVYTPGKFTLKAIYSRGILNVSNWTKFSSAGNRIPNPNLGTENIMNYELSAGYRLSKMFQADVSFYEDFIDNVVGLVPVEGNPTKTQNQNIGRFRIFGLLANVNFQYESFTAFVNYTFCHPFQTYSEKGDVSNRVGDIASHMFNVGVNKLFWDQLGIDLRLNFTGPRPVGDGTTVPANTESFPALAILNGAITYSNSKIVPGLSLQLVCNNILGTKYFHPGPKSADGIVNPTEILQRGRHFLIQLAYTF